MATAQDQPQTASAEANGLGTKSGKPSNVASRKHRPRRPNYNEIHSKPLPLDIYPLPAFIPHNPISIVRIAIALLSPSIWRPSSHARVHKAYFSNETQSIHVTDPGAIRALWEQGFWGTGSLSRSEPQWLAEQKRKHGIDAIATSQEVTRKRRDERRQFKLERAKAQREAIEQQLREEGKLDAETNLEELVENGSVAESPMGTLYSADASVPLSDATAATSGSVMDEVGKALAKEMPSFDTQNQDQEHLQLTFEEAFFLTYVLGVLEVYRNNTPLGSKELLRLICAHSELDPRLSYDTSSIHPKAPRRTLMLHSIEPDNSFMLKYVVFHHFRSLGWVVRSGIKFACDYLLYLRGPAFAHAEFAIMIIPAYSDPYWSTTAERAAECKEKAQKDWWWLHRLNRVQTQVHKTLLLVYVEVPPPWDETGLYYEHAGLGNILKRYRVREFVWRRWSPNRNRD